MGRLRHALAAGQRWSASTARMVALAVALASPLEPRRPRSSRRTWSSTWCSWWWPPRCWSCGRPVPGAQPRRCPARPRRLVRRVGTRAGMRRTATALFHPVVGRGAGHAGPVGVAPPGALRGGCDPRCSSTCWSTQPCSAPRPLVWAVALGRARDPVRRARRRAVAVRHRVAERRTGRCPGARSRAAVPDPRRDGPRVGSERRSRTSSSPACSCGCRRVSCTWASIAVLLVRWFVDLDTLAAPPGAAATGPIAGPATSPVAGPIAGRRTS